MASDSVRYDESDLTREILFKARSSGDTKSWNRVLTNPKFWSLRYPVEIMPYVDIKISLIDDLLFVYEETQYGSAPYYPINQPLRHLGPEIGQTIRINMAIVSLLGDKYIISPKPRQLQINESRMDELEDLRESYFTEWGKLKEGDIFDSVVFVGGTTLLQDMIADYTI